MEIQTSRFRWKNTKKHVVRSVAQRCEPYAVGWQPAPHPAHQPSNAARRSNWSAVTPSWARNGAKSRARKGSVSKANARRVGWGSAASSARMRSRRRSTPSIRSCGRTQLAREGHRPSKEKHTHTKPNNSNFDSRHSEATPLPGLVKRSRLNCVNKVQNSRMFPKIQKRHFLDSFAKQDLPECYGIPAHDGHTLLHGGVRCKWKIWKNTGV